MLVNAKLFIEIKTRQKKKTLRFYCCSKLRTIKSLDIEYEEINNFMTRDSECK